MRRCPKAQWPEAPSPKQEINDISTSPKMSFGQNHFFNPVNISNFHIAEDWVPTKHIPFPNSKLWISVWPSTAVILNMSDFWWATFTYLITYKWHSKMPKCNTAHPNSVSIVIFSLPLQQWYLCPTTLGLHSIWCIYLFFNQKQPSVSFPKCAAEQYHSLTH